MRRDGSSGSDMSEDVKAFIAAGNASLKAGDRNGAMLAWCRALDLDPHLATAHNNLGAISLMAGEPWLALPCFLNSTRLRPEQGGCRVGLARTLVELGEPERAAACLADAAKRLPDNAAVQEAAADTAQGIDRVARLDRKTFAARYFRARKPIIITDMATHWPAVQKWSFDFFAGLDPDRDDCSDQRHDRTDRRNR